MSDAERLHDIAQKRRCWGYPSHHPDAERDVAWLLDQLAGRDARIAELEARLRREMNGCYRAALANRRRSPPWPGWSQSAVSANYDA